MVSKTFVPIVAHLAQDFFLFTNAARALRPRGFKRDMEEKDEDGNWSAPLREEKPISAVPTRF